MADDDVGTADGPSNEERLKVYEISGKLKQPDLTISEGECVNVTLRGGGAERYQKSAHRIPVRTADDLKRVIGIPDDVARNGCRCPEGLVAAFPAGFETINDLSPAQREQLRAATDAYVYGDSQLVAHYATAIAKALSLVGKATVTLLGFADIVVERNAVLNVNPSVDVLFANKVVIKLGGRIRFTSPLKIDCTSIEGEEPFVTGTIGELTTGVLTHRALERGGQ